MESLKAR